MKKALFTLGMLMCASLPHIGEAQAPMPKFVWAHYYPVMPNDTHMQYGATYPITLMMPDDKSGADFQNRFVAMLKNTGVNGLSYEINPQINGKAPGLSAYEKMVAFLEKSSIAVAPCIDAGYYPGIENDMFNIITGAYDIARKYSNPAIQRDGRLIVFFYGSRELSADFWSTLRQRLAKAGYKVFLAGDIGVANEAPGQKMAIASRLAPNWDAAYNFSSAGTGSAADSNRNFSLNIQKSGRFWINSVMPGYFRGSARNGQYIGFGVDALGTQRLTDYWNEIIKSGSPWVYFTTANDFVEHTNLMPDSTWGHTRSDINLWFSSKFLGRTYPLRPAFYLTSPQIIYPDDKSSIEIAAINPSTQPLNLTYRLMDGKGNVLKTGVFRALAANFSALKIPVMRPSGSASSYRMEVRGAGAQILSAPVLFHNGPRAADRSPINYYSVSSREFSPGDTPLSIDWRAGIFTIKGLNLLNVLSADLLMNGNLIDQVKLPTGNPVLSVNRRLSFGRNSNDNGTRSGEQNKYVVRVVYKSGYIWYSDAYFDKQG